MSDALNPPQRTDRQNRALHLWLTQLADTLNMAGLDQRRVLKPSVAIPWTQESCKEQLWRPIQEAMFEKKSTTELTKGEVGRVEEVLVRHLGDRFGLELPLWPSMTEEEFISETTT